MFATAALQVEDFERWRSSGSPTAWPGWGSCPRGLHKPPECGSGQTALLAPGPGVRAALSSHLSPCVGPFLLGARRPGRGPGDRAGAWVTGRGPGPCLRRGVCSVHLLLLCDPPCPPTVASIKDGFGPTPCVAAPPPRPLALPLRRCWLCRDPAPSPQPFQGFRESAAEPARRGACRGQTGPQGMQAAGPRRLLYERWSCLQPAVGAQARLPLPSSQGTIALMWPASRACTGQCLGLSG